MKILFRDVRSGDLFCMLNNSFLDHLWCEDLNEKSTPLIPGKPIFVLDPPKFMTDNNGRSKRLVTKVLYENKVCTLYAMPKWKYKAYVVLL